ncbi:PilZ domain-containing protein [Sporosarcina aquimarina]|uniref:PilZ domain-containing protein n=1 Tax=Sporosarcina aquimarina TaxID=114975 RepID=UPI001C8D76E7|nr:PilZ domain-containing protein [Sporosarcina aquimarina]MBY0221742.1 PilZ domain-containing protein [Sporosarcina aquimarina]
MRYNRHDYFRYEFNPQLPAKFRLQLDDEEKKLSNEGECELLDISTGGVKFFTFLDLPLHPKKLTLQLEFMLYQHRFEILGAVVWKQFVQHGFQYGFEFGEEQRVDAQIVEELKKRARLEKHLE